MLLASMTMHAQIGKIQFKETTHDFGKITQESKKVIYNFEFTNVGTGDLKVLNVKTSCGCTASDYTRTPIKPGEKGVIKVTYSTVNRPGAFRKSITVTVNDPDKPSLVLFINGIVGPKVKNKSDLYPTAMGNLKLMSNHLAFNDIFTTEIKTDSMKVYNNWGSPMSISFDQVPAHIKVKMVPETLNINEEGYIIVTYDAAKKKDFGLVYDRISIKTNDNVQPIKILSISARISQNFAIMTEKELKKAPKIILNESTFDFGNQKSGTIVTHRFEFVNDGKTKLEILKVSTSCGCTTTQMDQKSYKKKAKGFIEVVFDTTGRKGLQSKTITVITNDPKNPEITLTISGNLN